MQIYLINEFYGEDLSRHKRNLNQQPFNRLEVALCLLPIPIAPIAVVSNMLRTMRSSL
jgi:hypothetical protein